MKANEYSALFKYNDGTKELPEGCFKISPSGAEKFFSDKVTWYKENLLGEPKKFTGSTSTVLGTVVHACAEVVANSLQTNTAYDKEELKIAVEKYIYEYEDDPEYNTEKIRELWYDMSTELIRDFVLSANTIATENFISYELRDNIFVGGTYDAITSTVPNDNLLKPVGQLTLRDYKTATSKPTSFSWAYTLQAYTYAYILSKKGINISNVELCYVIQPTKTLPIRTFNFVKPFDTQAYNLIEGILNLIADSVFCFKGYPDLQYLLMGDYRLKKNDVPAP